MDERQRSAYLEALGIHDWIAQGAAVAEELDAGASAVVPAPMPAAEAQASVTEPPSPRAEARSAPADEPPDWLSDVPPPSEEYAVTLPPDGLTGDPEPVTLDHRLDHLDWRQLAARVAECQACDLHRNRTRTVFGVGLHEAELMVIGEAPGADEDRQGEPFVGPAGQLLNAMLAAIGLSRQQVYIANMVKCRPPDNRDPRPDEIASCGPYLHRQVALVKPRVILAVGAVAARNLLQLDEPVGRLRGREHRYQGIPLVVTYHPAYLLRSPDQKARAWQDLQRASRLIG